MKYYALTLDPLHIGAGGYRLGRVDNTIVRDAGSGLPKVPGSSLAGAARCYAGWALKDAGQESSGGRSTVDTIFGYAADESGKESRIGLLHFYDGRILAFPVRSMAGPVWVTCPSVLAMNGIALDREPENEKLLINFRLDAEKLNLGWLYLPAEKIEFSLGLKGDTGRLVNRIAIAPDWLFTEIVNSNLEVRTSVSIDPETGAAKQGALFTYEAIPAAALLAFDIELDEHRCPAEWPAGKVAELLDRALAGCEALGLGGMTTRGFGRVRFEKKEA
ncbi:MAG: type III-B CRISPR module RAMP protein Cmr4 [Mailhella sp.]|nr:type III-B CRISPR module RAMP protein Cmr4 [Mailhella sp.]